MKIITFILFVILVSFTAVESMASEKHSLASVERSFLRGDYDRCISTADELMESSSLSRKEKGEVLYLKALSFLKEERFKDARSSFEALISKSPGSGRAMDAYMGIGDSYFLEGNTSAAISAYEDILDKYPDNKNLSVMYYRLGDCFKKSGREDKAREYFDKAKTASPLSFEANMMPALTAARSVEKVSSGYFSVQVGSFKSRRNAEKFVSKLSGLGFDSFMEIPTGSADNLYRVKVGKFRTRQQAEQSASRLKKLKYPTKICDQGVCE